MASEQDFMNAVSASRGGSAAEAKAWPDASAGSLGGFPAGASQNDSMPGSEFAVGVQQARMYNPVVTPAPAGPDGEFGFMRPDRSPHEYTPSSEFNSGAMNTCGGDAQISKHWPDASGGQLGRSSDSDKSSAPSL